MSRYDSSNSPPNNSATAFRHHFPYRRQFPTGLDPATAAHDPNPISYRLSDNVIDYAPSTRPHKTPIFNSSQYRADPRTATYRLEDRDPSTPIATPSNPASFDLANHHSHSQTLPHSQPSPSSPSQPLPSSSSPLHPRLLHQQHRHQQKPLHQQQQQQQQQHHHQLHQQQHQQQQQQQQHRHHHLQHQLGSLSATNSNNNLIRNGPTPPPNNPMTVSHPAAAQHVQPNSSLHLRTLGNAPSQFISQHSTTTGPSASARDYVSASLPSHPSAKQPANACLSRSDSSNDPHTASQPAMSDLQSENWFRDRDMLPIDPSSSAPMSTTVPVHNSSMSAAEHAFMPTASGHHLNQVQGMPSTAPSHTGDARAMATNRVYLSQHPATYDDRMLGRPFMGRDLDLQQQHQHRQQQHQQQTHFHQDANRFHENMRYVAYNGGEGFPTSAGMPMSGSATVQLHQGDAMDGRNRHVQLSSGLHTTPTPISKTMTTSSMAKSSMAPSSTNAFGAVGTTASQGDLPGVTGGNTTGRTAGSSTLPNGSQRPGHSQSGRRGTKGVSTHSRVCNNCAQSDTRQWVRGENQVWLCHSCGQFWRKNGYARPRALWGRPTFKRSSRKAKNNESSAATAAAVAIGVKKGKNGNSAEEQGKSSQGGSTGGSDDRKRRSRPVRKDVMSSNFLNGKKLVQCEERLPPLVVSGGIATPVTCSALPIGSTCRAGDVGSDSTTPTPSPPAGASAPGSGGTGPGSGSGGGGGAGSGTRAGAAAGGQQHSQTFGVNRGDGVGFNIGGGHEESEAVNGDLVYDLDNSRLPSMSSLMPDGQTNGNGSRS